jgi:FKBP-type peptidyl-prolyl cis-trans isomerase FkpA
MFKKLILGTAVVAGLASCDKTGKMETTPSGLKYMFHKRDEKGKKAKEGDILTMQIVFKTSKDSVLRNTFTEPEPLRVPLQKPPFKGSLEEGLSLVSPGDSVTFYVKADSLFNPAMGQPMPPFIEKGSDIAFIVKVSNIQTQAEMQKEMADMAVKQKETDAKAIADYIAKNNLANVQKTASGLNYIITQPGTGKQATPSSVVSVKYTGKLLDGTEFDSSERQGGQPVEFPLNQVIPGWTEGIALMKEGSKATLIIPSEMAYGQQGRPGIPKNSVLLFDVELLQVKDAGAAGMPGMPGRP